VTLIAGDPHAVARSLAKGDARPQLLALAGASSNGALPVIAVGKLPNLSAVWDQGKRLPVTIVGRVRAFPGSTAGTPSVVVARSALGRAATRAGLADPLPGATGAIWAKGDPVTIKRAFAASKLYPSYVTTNADLLAIPAIAAATRTYGFFDWIGIAAAALALAAVLLYLHARQRGQLIASALAQRMGLSRAGDAAALALEAAAITATAVCVGELARRAHCPRTREPCRSARAVVTVARARRPLELAHHHAGRSHHDRGAPGRSSGDGGRPRRRRAGAPRCLSRS